MQSRVVVRVFMHQTELMKSVEIPEKEKGWHTEVHFSLVDKVN